MGNPPQTPQVKPWSEIAKNFDPMMPAEQYDALRLKYFGDFVKPKVPKGKDVAATWAEFKNLTERPKLLGAADKGKLHIELGMASAVTAAMEPLKDLHPEWRKLYDKAQAKELELTQMGEREGMNTKAARIAGGFTGQAIDFAALSYVLGPAAGALSETMLSSAKSVDLASKMIRGGMAFGAYDAMSDESGNRMMAGLKGFATGAAFDLALGLPGFLKARGLAATDAEASRIIDSVNAGTNKNPAVDKAVSEKIAHDTKTARLELRPEKSQWSFSTGLRGARVYAKDVSGQIVPFDIKPGREYDTYRQLRSLVEQGGSVSHYEVHPENTGAISEFIRIQTLAEDGKYRGTVIRTAPGQAQAVATTAKKEGIPAVALSDRTVEAQTVPVEHPVLARPQDVFTTARGDRTVISAPPERVPSKVELTQALGKREFDDKTKMFLERQFEKVWDPSLEWEEKRSAVVILARDIPEMLPAAQRAKAPAFDRQGNLVREVAEARVQDISKRVLGSELNVEGVVKGPGGKAVVNVTANLSEEQLAKLHAGLGSQYEVRVPKRGMSKKALAQQWSEDQVQDLLSSRGLKPEDFDVEAIRTGGGEAELERQLAIKQAGMHGKPTSKPRYSLLDKVPANEQHEFKTVRDGIRYGGNTHRSVQDAIDQSGQRFLFNPAGVKTVATQLEEASLKGRLMGSIEDVPVEDSVRVGQALRMKGWQVAPLRGYKQGMLELVYFREADALKVAPLLNDFDQYISKEAGRVFDTNGQPIRSIGDQAHTRLGSAFGVPKDEVEPWLEAKRQSVGGSKLAPEISRKPYGDRLVLQFEDLQALHQGAAALAVPSMDEFVKDLGITLPASLQSPGPLIILTPETPRDVVWHERLHINGMYAGVHDNFPDHIPDDVRQTALDLAGGIGKLFDGYDKMPQHLKLEEAFTHAATAVRHADGPYLDELARYDTSVAHVRDFVNQTAQRLLEAATEHLPPGDPPQVRIYQRTLKDLIRRSSEDVSDSLRSAGRDTGTSNAVWYDHDSDMWVMKEGHSKELKFKDINDVYDYTLERDKNFMSPSMSLRAELGGVRGPITPIGKEPVGDAPPVPELPPEGRYIGASAVSALWRPFFPWLSTLHENMNAVWRKSGKYLPLYESAKAVDDQFRAGDTWLQQNYEKIHELLQPFKSGKMRSVFDYLTYPEVERTTKLMQKYGLNQQEGIAAHKVWEYMKDFRTDTNINVSQYMLEYHPKLRGFSWDPTRVFGQLSTPQTASFFDKLIRHDGKWDPQDAHLGRFLHVMLREGMEKKFTGEPLGKLEKLVNLKTEEGHYVIPAAVRWPLTNYVNYMHGIPDTSTKIINKTMEEFFSGLNTKLKQMGLPQISSPPKQMLQRFMLMSYAMGLGMRPAIAMRDMMQAFTGGMTVMGPSRFARAFTRFMSAPHNGFELADRYGALLRKNNAGELYGDIFQEVPPSGAGWMDRLSKWSNTLLSPSRWGHNFGRAITFNGEYHDTLGAIKDFRAGRIDADRLLEQTSIWFMDKPAQTQMMRLAQDVHTPVEDAAAKIALEAVDLTQWPYRRGTQPTLLRYGAGRIFGQYGVWPANYADFLYRIGKKWSERPKIAARTTATWVAVNFALTHAMESAGADTSKWFWQSPAGFAGSPHWDFVHALMTAPENTEEGHAARKTILEYPLDFVPAMAEMKAVLKVIQDGKVNQWPPDNPSLLRLLGFRPIDELKQDQDWSDMVKTQLGYEATRRRR
jgi:hypothetical protein